MPNILSTFYKNTILRITIILYNAANIISRNDGENVKDKDKTIKVLTNYYFKFFGNDKNDQTYVQYIFMLRLLKFMGDRSHIVMAKLVEKASGENDDSISDFIYW